MKKPITITLEKDLLDEIEEKKGFVSRSKFIELLIIHALQEEGEEERLVTGYA